MTEDSAAQVLNTQIQYRLIEALSTSEARYQRLLNSLSEVVFSLDVNGCFSILNQAWQNHTGFLIHDCLGKNISDFMPENEYIRFREKIGKGDFREEFLIFNCHRQLLWFDISVTIIDGYFYGSMVSINELKKSTKILEEAEQQFKVVVENLVEILFQADPKLNILFLNPAWIDITGHDPEQSLGSCLLDYMGDDDSLAFAQAWLNHPVGTIHRQEIQLRCQDNSLRWVSAQVRTVMDIQGEPLITGVMLDIHERKSMEASLRRSEERFALLVSSTTDGIWDWDLNTDEVFFSTRWKEMLGYQDEELENRFATWYTRVHPDDIRPAMDDVMACLEGKRPVYENIHRMQHREGHWLWILDRGIVLRDEKGLPYRMIGSHADVTRLKKVEQALQRRERELEAVVNISPDGIVTVSPLGLIQSVNPSFLQMTGFDKDKLIGMTEDAFDAILLQISKYEGVQNHKSSLSHYIYQIDLSKLCRHSLRGGSFSGCPDEQLHTPKLRVLSRTERHLQSDEIAKVMYFRDITVETEVDQMKSQFLSTAAHELRTPMASVYGFSELLLSRDFDAETTREILSTIHQQSESLVTMLNQLLDLARIESRMGMDFSFKHQPLSPIIRRACSEIFVPGDHRAVKLNLPRKEYWVDVDADKLRQVIINVLANAYKYSPNGGDISLRLRAKPPINGGETEIGIVIKDHGIGMTKEQLKHVFERFWRANPVNDIPGTGLGMSLVKEIMDIHQGRISLNSKPNMGTTVTLWLKMLPLDLDHVD